MGRKQPREWNLSCFLVLWDILNSLRLEKNAKYPTHVPPTWLPGKSCGGMRTYYTTGTAVVVKLSDIKFLPVEVPRWFLLLVEAGFASCPPAPPMATCRVHTLSRY